MTDGRMLLQAHKRVIWHCVHVTPTNEYIRHMSVSGRYCRAVLVPDPINDILYQT